MTDEKRERLNALGEKMKDLKASSDKAKEEAASGGRATGQRLTPGAAAGTAAKPTATAAKPTATASAAKPTAATVTAAKPTATAAKPTTTATAAKPTATTTAAKPTATTATATAAKPTATAAAPKVNFADVPTNAYYAEAVAWAVQQGITSGTTPTTFTPDNPCHRGHTATFIWRAKGSPKPKSSRNPFKDVSDGPFYQAILWATGENILSGTSADTFEHTAPCTRRQVLTCLMRAEGNPNATETDAVKWAAHKSLMTGMTGGVDAVCTRADMVTFLYRLRKK